jgi:hypothetical protein
MGALYSKSRPEEEDLQGPTYLIVYYVDIKTNIVYP